jgi:hypothetical protein
MRWRSVISALKWTAAARARAKKLDKLAEQLNDLINNPWVGTG